MVGEKIIIKTTLKEKLLALLASGLVFSIVYNFCGWYTTHSDRVGSFVLNFENSIPFLPWMIIPYMCSGLLFIIIFFCCPYRKQFYLLTKRINFITILSGIIFIMFPLKHAFIKPDIHSSFLSFFFQFLNTWDTNYNQAPSLHISYAIIFWSVLYNIQNKTVRYITCIWLILMCVSTLTIFQHHLIDIAASFVLVSITFFIFPAQKTRNYKVGAIYIITSTLLLFVSLLTYQYINLLSLLIVGLSLMLFSIGIAYKKSNARFLKNQNGTISFIKKIIYFPYIFTYKIMRLLFCQNTEQSVAEVFPHIFLGPILNSKEIVKADFDLSQTIIIDLSAEIEESFTIRNRAVSYYSYPILDIGTLDPNELLNLIKSISEIYSRLQPGEKIYIHCLMGYSRCTFITAAFISNKLNITIQQSINLIRKKYAKAIFTQYLLALAHENNINL